MCTLVVLNECIEGYPLVVAANRDERYDRKSLPPEEHGDLIRPWDEERDGTWMGIRRDGWFVGITNQDDGKHDEHALSRGKIVSSCLEAESHCAVAKVLKALDPARYNPFNLVFGRPGVLFLARVWAGHELELIPIEPGVSVISNDCWDHHYDRKVERTTQLVKAIKPKHHIVQIVDELWSAMHDHDASEDPFQSLCVHAEEHAFGTRSTSIITVSNQKDVDYWYSEGHPCQSKMLMCVGHMPHSE